MLHDLIVTWFQWVHDFGYAGVVLLMAAESSILPVPSEIVIPPAAYWATQGKMSLVGVVIAGTLGSLIGSLVMYYVSRQFGRPFLLRHGKWFFVSPEKLERAERFLARYETGGVFFARLLPVVRHLIGIPAGIVRMRVVPYAIATTVGSAVWCSVLAWFGQEVLGSEPKLLEDPNAMITALKHKSWPILGAVVALLALYILVVKLTDKKQPAS